jgi:hypothetical protein
MIHWLRFHVSLLANRQVDFMESFGFAVADMMLKQRGENSELAYQGGMRGARIRRVAASSRGCAMLNDVVYNKVSC